MKTSFDTLVEVVDICIDLCKIFLSNRQSIIEYYATMLL